MKRAGTVAAPETALQLSAGDGVLSGHAWQPAAVVTTALRGRGRSYTLITRCASSLCPGLGRTGHEYG